MLEISIASRVYRMRGSRFRSGVLRQFRILRAGPIVSLYPILRSHLVGNAYPARSLGSRPDRRAVSSASNQCSSRLAG